jgi:hypothetical protein
MTREIVMALMLPHHTFRFYRKTKIISLARHQVGRASSFERLTRFARLSWRPLS